VRTEEGLAYSVSSSFPTTTRDIGLFRVTVQTKNENVPRAVRTILDEMTRMRDSWYADGADRREGSHHQFLVFRFTSRFSVVTQLLALEFDEYPPDYLDTLLDRYRAVTREDVQRVAGSICDRMTPPSSSSAHGADRVLPERLRSREPAPGSRRRMNRENAQASPGPTDPSRLAPAVAREPSPSQGSERGMNTRAS